MQTVALQAQEAMRASTRVAVSATDGRRILGYFTLVGVRVIDAEMPPDLARQLTIRNFVSGAPAVLLAQLGVDRSQQGTGLGTFLLGRALRQALAGAVEIGGVALLVDAVNQTTATWYRRRVPDFRPLTDDGLRLVLAMSTLATAAAS